MASVATRQTGDLAQDGTSNLLRYQGYHTGYQKGYQYSTHTRVQVTLAESLVTLQDPLLAGGRADIRSGARDGGTNGDVRTCGPNVAEESGTATQ